MKTCIATTMAAVTILTLLAGCSREAEQQGAAPQRSPKVAAAPQDRAMPPTTPAASPASPDPINDTMITSRIKAGILSDPGMSGSDVSVNTDHGVVSLTGIIKSQEQAAIASAHAQRQDGVMRVDNMLAVNLH